MNTMRIAAGLGALVVALGVATAATARNDPAIPDGVYRANVAAAALQAAGMTPRDARANGGTQSLTLKGERWRLSREGQSARLRRTAHLLGGAGRVPLART